MARVALSRSLRNSIEVSKGAAYAQSLLSPMEPSLMPATPPSLKAIDTSRPLSELISYTMERLSRAHMFHFRPLVSEIACLPSEAPVLGSLRYYLVACLRRK